MTNYFQRIFGRSPFQPLQKHIEACYRCAQLVVPLLEQVADGDWAQVTATQNEIAALEEEADEIKRDIRAHLPQGFFLPVARPDLLGLLNQQDAMANRAKDIAGLILGRKLRFPEQMRKTMTEFATVAVQACDQARTVIQELDELLDTGFGGSEATRVAAMISEVDLVERRCDELERIARAELFELEDGLKPVDVTFMYRIIDWIGDLADIAQMVGHRLELLLNR